MTWGRTYHLKPQLRGAYGPCFREESYTNSRDSSPTFPVLPRSHWPAQTNGSAIHVLGRPALLNCPPEFTASAFRRQLGVVRQPARFTYESSDVTVLYADTLSSQSHLACLTGHLGTGYAHYSRALPLLGCSQIDVRTRRGAR